MICTRPQVAGTILPDKFNRLQIKGVQFKGEVLNVGNPLAQRGHNAYHRQYPFSLVIPGEVWAIRLDIVKFIDNSLGFGRKLQWERAGTSSVQ